MTKAEEKKAQRLKRKLEKLIKKQNKNARLASSIEIKDKYVRGSCTPNLTKSPYSQSPDNYKKYYFSWCYSHADTNELWSWGEPRKWSSDEYTSIIALHMDSQINEPWSAIETKNYSGKNKHRKLLNKYQKLDSLSNEAQSRWMSLEQISEFENLFRLRLGSNKRIWGIRIQHHFYMIWYERNHKICPVGKI